MNEELKACLDNIQEALLKIKELKDLTVGDVLHAKREYNFSDGLIDEIFLTN